MRKGDLVKLNERALEMGNYFDKEQMRYGASRLLSEDERNRWRARRNQNVRAGLETWHDDAGEPTLPPKTEIVYLYSHKVYPVLRARCRVELGWGRAQGGMTKVLDTQTGEEVYIKRDYLDVVACKGS